MGGALSFVKNNEGRAANNHKSVSNNVCGGNTTIKDKRTWQRKQGKALKDSSKKWNSD